MSKHDRAIVATRNYLDDDADGSIVPINRHRDRASPINSIKELERLPLSSKTTLFYGSTPTSRIYARARTVFAFTDEASLTGRHLTQSTRAVQCKALKRYVIEFDKRPDTAPVRATISRTLAEYQGERSLETYKINRSF